MRRFLPWRRRRPTRHTARIPCQVVRERDFTLVADQVVNLSTTGMLVTPADPVLTGESVIVSFKAPLSRSVIDAQAWVTRVVHGRRPGEYTRALGLEFEDLDSWSHLLLERNLPWLPIAPPGPRPGRRKSKSAVWSLARATGRAAASMRDY